MLKVISAVLLAVFASNVHAEEVDVYVTATLRSYHINRSAHRNEDNPGLGVEISSGDFRYALATYKNSFEKQTVMASVAWLPISIGPTNSGATLGAVTGYPQYGGKIGPFGAFVTEYVNGNFGVNFIVTPPAKTGDTSTKGVVSFQLKYKV